MSVSLNRLLNFHETAAFGPMMAIASLAMGAIGTGISAAGSIAAGQNAQAMGNFQQREYGEQAMNDVATGQRKMLDQQRQGDIVKSRLVAAAAGNGINATDGSTSVLGQQIAGRSEYSSLMDLSQSRNAAAGLTNMGSGAKYQGDLSNAMAPYAAFGSVAGGAGSMFKDASKIQWG